jgi:acyl-CoA thioesterase-1
MRRSFLILGLCLPLTICALVGCGQPDTSTPAGSRHDFVGTIVAVGDSLTAGYGVTEFEAYPAQLERKLLADGYRYKVVNAGVSGETSSGALSRINWVLTLKPDMVILESGANDGLRGIDPELTMQNLHAIVAAFKAHGVTVVLAGMQMVHNLGAEYTSKFAEKYLSVAREQHVILIPFFLAGVAGEPLFNQEDGIHPNAKGYTIITANIYPYIVEAIKERQAAPRR